jgi:hypothetical protein
MSELPHGFYKATFQPADGSTPIEMHGEIKIGWFRSDNRLGDVSAMVAKGWVFTRDEFFEDIIQSMKEMIHA